MNVKSPILRCIGAWPLRSFLWNFLICLSVPLLLFALRTGLPLPELARQYGYSLIYGTCISIILSTAMPVAFVISESWPRGRQWALRVAVVMVGVTLGTMAAGLVLQRLLPGYQYWHELPYALRISLILSSLVVAFVWLYKSYQAKLEASAMQLKTKELERERALKLATEAQLSSLESRLQPHFLFNTINSVSSLIHDDPVRAEQLLSRMAALLRFSLDSTRAGLVPLEQELRVVKDYLEIEKTRFEGRLAYEVEAPDSVLSAAVPPLAIQTLVENSIKYAVAPRRQGARVTVRASEQSGSLVVSVIDDGPGFDMTNLIAGHGIDHLQERLATLFKDRAQLEIIGLPGNAEVRITLPMTAPAGPGLLNGASPKVAT